MKFQFYMPLTFVVLLPGCLSQTDLNVRQSRLLHQRVFYHDSKNNVDIWVKKLDSQESKSLFKGSMKRSFRGSKQLYPIEITIENRSDAFWKIYRHGISLSLYELQDVISNTDGRPLKRGLSLAGAGILAVIGINSVVGPLIALPFAFGIPLLVASGTANMVENTNSKKQTFEKYMLNDDCIVHPSQKIRTYIFVQAEDYESNFTIPMYNPESGEDLSFQVQLKEV